MSDGSTSLPFYPQMMLTIEALCMLGLMCVRSQKQPARPIEVITSKVAEDEVSRYCPWKTSLEISICAVAPRAASESKNSDLDIRNSLLAAQVAQIVNAIHAHAKADRMKETRMISHCSAIT